ncbi:hypothetical protein FRC11_013469 [Ceratobasidium sp. 423]|nr:hypothetical protein FRC11_013469 [Ceratobasidium sp. 423]
MQPVPVPDTHIGGMAGGAKKWASEHKDDSSEYGEEGIDKPVLNKVQIHIRNQDVPNEPVGEDEDVDELIDNDDIMEPVEPEMMDDKKVEKAEDMNEVKGKAEQILHNKDQIKK